MKYRKVFFTGNVLRFWPHIPTRTNQIGNIEWLADLLTPVLKNSDAGELSRLVWSESSRFDSRVLYERQRRPFSREGYVQMLGDEPSPAVVDYLRDFVSEEDLLIGYEVPDFLFKAFCALGVRCIDIMLAPWRFLPDLAFGVRTSDPSAFRNLLSYRLTDAELAVYAAPLRARLGRMPRVELPPRSAVFAGQVADDVSLATDGRFLSIQDFSDDLRRISSEHSRLLFKPHPYAMRSDVRRQYRFLKRLGNVRVTNANIYYLMAQPSVGHVYALTSSVTKEAQFFGAGGTSLAPYPFSFAESEESGTLSFVPIYGRLTSPSFWRDVFEFDLDLPEPVFPAGYLRTSLGLSWGADIDERTLLSRFDILLGKAKRFSRRLGFSGHSRR